MGGAAIKDQHVIQGEVRGECPRVFFGFHRKLVRTKTQQIRYKLIKDPHPPPPCIARKHFLVQSCIECTEFSDENYFFNWIYFILIPREWNLSPTISGDGFYYIRCCIRWDFLFWNLITLVGYIELTFQVLVGKREIQSVFCKTEKVSSI